MPPTAYRRFSKTTHRITLLYEVTVDGYRLLYESGRKRLRKENVGTATREIVLQNKTVRKRPLSQLTYQARDVYPQILRSTLLIRLVAAYEAFLTDVLRELVNRSTDFLKSDQRLEFSQEHLLSLIEKQEVEDFILTKTLRSLSNGGFKDIVKFYKKMSIDVVPPGVTVKDLEEIHDRRHLYVHGSGRADEQYCSRYPNSGASPDILLPVEEAYLFTSIKQLEDSAKHVENQLRAKFPEIDWVYTKGSKQLSDQLEHLNLFSGFVNNEAALDFNNVLSDGTTALGGLVVWVGRRKNEFKLLVGGSAADAGLYSKHIYLAEERGDITKMISEKLVR